MLASITQIFIQGFKQSVTQAFETSFHIKIVLLNLKLNTLSFCLIVSLGFMPAWSSPQFSTDNMASSKGSQASQSQLNSETLGEAAASEGMNKSVIPTTLEAMESLLKSESGASWNQDRYMPSVLKALSRIEEARSVLSKDPKHDDKNKMMTNCELLTKAALAEIAYEKNSAEMGIIKQKRDSLLTELSRIHQEINQIERGYSSSLKRDLDEERRKALQRQDDARKRFDDLQSDMIQVRKDARGIILSMSDILFDVGKASLTPTLKTNLAKIAGILTVYKEAEVIVEGHTDNQGSEDLNQKLSEKRAANVLDFMVTLGIGPQRLKAMGYGFTKPVAENSTAEGRKKNRRVDLIISDKAAQ